MSTLPMGAVIFFLLTFRIASANKPAEMTLEERSKESDLVVIAEVLSVSAEICHRQSRCANMLVSSVLKGEPKGDIVFMVDGPLPEFRPKCCVVGNTYLFF